VGIQFSEWGQDLTKWGINLTKIDANLTEWGQDSQTGDTIGQSGDKT